MGAEQLLLDLLAKFVYDVLAVFDGVAMYFMPGVPV